MPEIIIRKFNKREGDVEAIHYLYQQLTGHLFKFDLFKERFNFMLEFERQTIFVAELDEKIVGYIAIVLNYGLYEGKHLRIAGLVVDKSVKRKGVGSKLVLEAEKWAKANNIELIKLRSNTARAEEAHEFYINRGYSKVKECACFEKKII